MNPPIEGFTRLDKSSSSLQSGVLRLGEKRMLQWKNARLVFLLVTLGSLAAAFGNWGWKLLNWGW